MHLDKRLACSWTVECTLHVRLDGDGTPHRRPPGSFVFESTPLPNPEYDHAWNRASKSLQSRGQTAKTANITFAKQLAKQALATAASTSTEDRGGDRFDCYIDLD